MNIQLLVKKLTAALVALLISWGVVAAPQPPQEGVKADASLVFANSEPGSAEGTLTVTANFDGKYEVYWGDEDGVRLSAQNKNGDAVAYSYFAEVEVENKTGTKTLSSFLAIPEGAECTLLYYGDELLDTDALPEEKKADYSGKVYSFGALSDVHYNRYSKSSKDDAAVAFPKAMDFLEIMDVSIVGMCGDLSFAGESSAFKNVGAVASNYSFPTFTCRGNHDCGNKFNLKAWQKYLNKGVYSEEKLPGVLDVADNGYDFVYSGEETHGDVFIFFSQISGVYAPGIRLVTDKQLDWLSKQFETYKEKRVYLFFHTFFNAPSGKGAMGEGNLVNDYGISYSLPYFKGNKDEKRFWGLLEEYKNVTFFNGHSHFTYAMESYNPRLNITDYDGTTATMVHVSSVTAPRTTSITQPKLTSNPGKMSEGLYITVYPTYMIVTACDFMNGEFLAYANYRIDMK